jgi:hypothetical protein
MVGGTKYFSENQINYTFYKMNGDYEKAEYYLNLCMEEVKKEQEMYNKMKSIDEIKEIKSIDI